MEPVIPSKQAALTNSREIAVAVVNELFLRFGVNLDDREDVKSLQADFAYMRKARKGAEDIARIVRRSAIAVAMSAIAYAVWQGILHLLANSASR